MVEPSSIQNVEKDLKDQSLDHHDEAQTLSCGQHIITVPFAGRVGGNQAFIFDLETSPLLPFFRMLQIPHLG